MTFWLLALAALMFGLYNVFIKISSDHINPVLGAVVLQLVAAVVGLGLLGHLALRSGETLQVSPRGLFLAACAGVAIGLVEILTFAIYGRGLPVAVGNPLIIGGSLLVTTLVGILLLRELVNPLQLFAIALIGAGVSLLALAAAR